MKRVFMFGCLAGFVVTLASGCYLTPDQKLAQAKPMAGGNHGNAPAWSWDFVPTTFEGTRILLSPNYQVVKASRAETNSNHQVVQVSYDVIEDAFGRPVAMPPSP